jgi:heme-degrading monooxygenase HmoA
MNDYLITRARDVPRVAMNGLRFRRAWPRTPGALGLWVASTGDGRRQVSVSVWRTPEDLKRFVRTPNHLRVMRDFRHAGHLYTNAWTAPRLDRALIWRQAYDRLTGELPDVPHH